MQAYLGIETSCDETAAAIVADGRRILSNKLFSQISTHTKFGGVVPEVAAREHLDVINLVIDDALVESGLNPSDLAGIAYTAGPGLIGALLVGASAAKTLAYSWDLPLISVDHLSAHICSNYLESDLEPPFVALLVSGGHSQIIYCRGYNEAELLGESVDDAVGEAYDKVARLLGLGYPGGPAIDSIAKAGDPNAFKFPEGVVEGFNFSFSGLKTAVARCVQRLKTPPQVPPAPPVPLPVADLAASFQEAVIRVLVRKTISAQELTRAPLIVLAGGVSANSRLRSLFTELSPVPVHFPRIELCTDNAAMVASAAYFCGNTVGLDSQVYSRTYKGTSLRTIGTSPDLL